MTATVNSVTSPPVSDTLKPKLRAAATKIETWTVERNRLICEAMDAGSTSREVADLVGLTHAGVLKIWRRPK